MPEARIIPFDGDRPARGAKKKRAPAGEGGGESADATAGSRPAKARAAAPRRATKAGTVPEAGTKARADSKGGAGAKARATAAPRGKSAKARVDEKSGDDRTAVPVETAGDPTLVSPAAATRPSAGLRDLGQFRREAGGAPVDPDATGAAPAAGATRATAAAADGPDTPAGDPWDRKVAGVLAFLRRRLTGEYEVDEFGFDPELTDTVLAAPFRPLYEKWFRVEVSGMQNVPDTGGALIVANHSGTVALDGVITALALLDHHPARRHLRLLGADLVFKTPFVGEFARKAGNTLACQADAERLLSSGELVGVYPEGFKGVGKPFADRYKLQRFGRGGFVSAALATKVPIIPCAIVGAEEIYPMLGNAPLLARLLGAPYFPLTPTFPWLGLLGMIPLPSKWYIEFGPPDRDRRPRRRGGRPDADVQPHRPGARDDPAVALPPADEADVGLRLKTASDASGHGHRISHPRRAVADEEPRR